MESGKPCAALLSKSYTVALLYTSAAAAERTKEGSRGDCLCEQGGGREENRKGMEWPISVGRDNRVICPVLGLSCWAPKFDLTYRSVQAEEM